MPATRPAPSCTTRRCARQTSSRTLDDLEPAIKDALDRTLAADAAREKVEDDLLPKLQDALHAAAGHAAVVEAGKRGTAAMAALKGELEFPPKKEQVEELPASSRPSS